MRFSSPIAVIVMTLTLMTAPSAVKAGNQYFANISPWTNYLHRCLGIGWSDGYHAPGGWAVTQPQNNYQQYPSPVHLEHQPLTQKSMTRHYHQTHAVTFSARDGYPRPQQPAPLAQQPRSSPHRQAPMVRH